eukprot:TRINITY_DN6837_c0_g1_i27.p1 TRINITY_DN6837_c0_g1~~TRINITY_DN6837_c0_g1_i27.p1  ORF type:complete len:387 (+),score=106.40 TRINITY_DN6837_c0_g1_i27:193-1353(+)
MSSSLNVKYGSSQSYTINVELSWTVAQVKKELEAVSTVSSDLQRLIYAGQVMNNERTLESYNVKDGHTVHLVCRKPLAQSQPTQPSTQPTQPQPQSQPQTQPQPQPQVPPVQPQFPAGFNFNSFAPQPGVQPSFGLPLNPALIANLMSDPNIQNMLAQVFQNPQILQQMLQSDPLAQAYLSNPAVAAALQNPGFLRQMSDPAVLQAVYGALGGGPGGAFGGGFGGAGGAFGGTTGGGFGGAGGATGGGTVGGEAGGASGAAGGSTPAAAGTVPVGGGAAGNNPAFPSFPPFFGANPFFGGIPPTQNPQGGQPAVGVNPGFNPNPAGQPNFAQMFSGIPAQEAPEQRFAIQLQQLQDMGFNNRQVNIQILTSTFGNVEAAVERLLRG